MYVGLKQPRGDGERYVTPARAAAKETKLTLDRHTNEWVDPCPTRMLRSKITRLATDFQLRF